MAGAALWGGVVVTGFTGASFSVALATSVGWVGVFGAGEDEDVKLVGLIVADGVTAPRVGAGLDGVAGAEVDGFTLCVFERVGALATGTVASAFGPNGKNPVCPDIRLIARRTPPRAKVRTIGFVKFAVPALPVACFGCLGALAAFAAFGAGAGLGVAATASAAALKACRLTAAF